MKKLVTVFAACAVAGLAFAADSNIVGYVTKTTAAGKMDIVGTHFQNIGDATINIQDVFPGVGIDLYGRDFLRIWNPLTATYITASYWGDTYDVEDVNGDNDLGPGWADEGQIRLDFTIDPGQGFWLQTRANASVTIAGEVLAADDNRASTAAGKMDILCNTFPVELNIQEITPVSGIDLYGRDFLRAWNPTTATYITASYWGDTYDVEDVNGDNDLGPGWADEGQIRLDFTINPGQGFWLQTRSAAVVSFPAPAGIL